MERFEDIITADGRIIGRRLVVDGGEIATTLRMTHFGFLSRLTPQERTAVRTATASDPILDDAMFLFNQAREIDVSLNTTQQLVGYLAATGLIAPERVPALLAPIAADSPHAVA